MTTPSPNFAYLAHHDPRLVALGTQAEEQFAVDPEACLFKLRKLAELLAKLAAAKVRMFVDSRESQLDLVNRLHDRGVIGATQRSLFHDLRRSGNVAVHDFAEIAQSEALHQLKMARELAIWFQRSFGNDRRFDPGPFVPPADPKKQSDAVHAELERLRAIASEQAGKLATAAAALEAARTAQVTAEERAAREAEDKAIWEALASESAEALAALDAKLAADLSAIQAAAEAAPPQAIQKTIEQAASASHDINLDEPATRKLVDKQLRDAGWSVDSETLTYSRGVRPQKGRNLAIAEWPTRSGPADYVLFLGEKAVAVVEAKRKMKDVPGAILQAKRYSQGFQHDAVEGGPWGEYRVPFLFATNGRPYLRQLRTKSGIWFLDARRKENISTALEGWYTPEGLRERLKLDVDQAHEQLRGEPTDYLGLRDYQLRAIASIEKGLEEGRREMLVAMATGTGKTRTCIGLVYRLLKTRRFRRVLFLVDRSALGHQTTAALKDMRLENLQTFTDIFDIKELGDIKPDPDTRMQLSTIQAMVQRILGAADEDVPPVDAYDCIVVDECHRGYLLDRELSDRELSFRDEADYISKYRRVLDHFDAVKIGLTATPALHTTEIFGHPITEYSYREAVIDGFLVDHEPPIQIVTKLAADGITWKAGEEMLVLDRGANVIAKSTLADDVNVEIDAFNKKVITENFNRAVLGELARHIDPEDRDKTLIFCVTDEHCDLVVTLLKEALTQQYGSVEDDAVVKITGAADKPLQLIRRYRNERQPSIAVTVDLLTTGIDVPPIANLVFLRRVRSRILYEQMLGRATRLCPEIGKERFRVFDAVDLYAAIASATDMKPVVVNPQITFEQLVKELVETEDGDVLDELLAKLQRKKKHVPAGELEAAAGLPLKELVQALRSGTAAAAARWFADHVELAALLDRKTNGGPGFQIISEHHDEIREVRHGYGGARRPEDYIESFRRFIESNMNKLPALLVVTQRPRELTRLELKELKLALDREGYNETALRTAWRDAKNEDLAASIIGYIRQMALGTPLLSYEERVEQAMKRIGKSRAWTSPQRKWLDRIGAQLKAETVVDRAALDGGEFKSHGGFARLNKVFAGELEQLLGAIQEEIWREGA